MGMRGICLALIISFVSIWSPVLAIEEPAFVRVSQEGDIEVRDYPAFIVAEVSVNGNQKTAVSRGFRMLAGYIFGANHGAEKISMTAPVSQAPRPGATLAMTAPVSQVGEANTWLVRFTMPKGFRLDALPKPNDPRIELKTVGPQRMAVIRFSGVMGPRLAAEQTAKLSAYLARRSLNALGPPVLAQYDPPWTPWFMRRNEIQIPITLAP
jgi:hypothetical protein